MKNPEQLKGAIRNLAKQQNLQAQEVLQIFLFERFIERLSLSPYRENFIIKGGFLISSILGIEKRTTMDLDTTVNAISMREDILEKVLREILSIDVEDGICFEFTRLTRIVESSSYENFRAHIKAKYGKMDVVLLVDITTGDIIIPEAVNFTFPLRFTDKTASVMAYPVETILSEKLEAILQRNTATTRMRDFYDIHLLLKLYKEKANWDILHKAVTMKAEERETYLSTEALRSLLKRLKNSEDLRNLWKWYQESFSYASQISFDDTLESIEELLRKINLI